MNVLPRSSLALLLAGLVLLCTLVAEVEWRGGESRAAAEYYEWRLPRRSDESHDGEAAATAGSREGATHETSPSPACEVVPALRLELYSNGGYVSKVLQTDGTIRVTTGVWVSRKDGTVVLDPDGAAVVLRRTVHGALTGTAKFTVEGGTSSAPYEMDRVPK